MVDSTIPYEVMTHLQAIDARLDALEAAGSGVTPTDETTEEEATEAPPTRSARGRS
jgi:hypothetical protein